MTDYIRQTPRSIVLLLSELTSSPSPAAYSTRIATVCLHTFVHTCPAGPCNVFLEHLSPPSIGRVLATATFFLLRSADERFPDLLLCVDRLRMCPCHTELPLAPDQVPYIIFFSRRCPVINNRDTGIKSTRTSRSRIHDMLPYHGTNRFQIWN